MEGAGDVRRRLDDRRTAAGSDRRSSRSRRARRRRRRASARRSARSNARRYVGLGQRLGRLRLGHLGTAPVATGPGPARRPGDENTPSSSGRTGSWYHLLVRRSGPARSSRSAGSAAPSRRAIGRHPHGSRATFSRRVPARLAPSRARFGGRPGPTPLGPRREARSLARGRMLRDPSPATRPILPRWPADPDRDHESIGTSRREAGSGLDGPIGDANGPAQARRAPRTGLPAQTWAAVLPRLGLPVHRWRRGRWVHLRAPSQALRGASSPLHTIAPRNWLGTRCSSRGGSKPASLGER